MTDKSGDLLRIIGETFPTGRHPGDPSAIAGREAYLLDVVRILEIGGRYPVIYGPKGVGKSTLVWQIELIVNRHWKAEDFASVFGLGEAPGSYYETLTLNCSALPEPGGDAVLAAIAGRLRRKHDELAKRESEEQQRIRREAIEKAYGGTAMLVPLPGQHHDPGAGHRPQAAATAEDIISLGENIGKLCGGAPLLFIIDDLDAIGDMGALASFLKIACWASPDLRFMLAGTAERPKDLLENRDLLDGVADWIRLEMMSGNEMSKMLARKAARLVERNQSLQFEAGVLASIAMISAGHPATAVKLSHDSITAALRKKSPSVTRDHLDDALRELVGELRSSASARGRSRLHQPGIS